MSTETITEEKQYIYTDWEEFRQKVGLIDDTEELRRIGAPEGAQSNGEYDIDKSLELVDFCRAHPQYHIATSLGIDWCNEVAGQLYEDWDDLEEAEDYDEMERRVDNVISTFAISNGWHWVDRMGYYLCSGDPDEQISLEEVEIQDEELAKKWEEICRKKSQSDS